MGFYEGGQGMLISSKFRCAGCMKKIDNEFAVCSCGYNNDTDTNALHCLQVGTLLNNSYMVGKVIGEGGFGITYVGYDINLDKKVAIKEFYLSGYSSRYAKKTSEISASMGEGEELFEINREKFINEAKVLGSFNDEPGIVSVYQYFKENNTAYIVMEYVEGTTLKECLKKYGKLSVDETIGIVGPILNSLSKIHEKGIVHRDISPDNIMITADGRGKLIDFGAAREANGGNKSLSVVLKHGYAPMEQYQTKGNQGPWTDVYAISATIYKCLTGIVPADATDRVMDDTLSDVCEYAKDCKRSVANVIHKGLSVNIDDRYKTVGEFKEAFLEALNSNDTDAATIKNGGQIKGEKEASDQAHNDVIVAPSNLENNNTTKQKKIWLYILPLVAAVAVILIALTLINAKNSRVKNGQDSVVATKNEETISSEEAIDAEQAELNVSEIESSSEEDTSTEEPSDTENHEENERILAEEMEGLVSASVGDIVTFGRYLLDAESGVDPIEWRVLDKSEDGLFLISVLAIDGGSFNDAEGNADWETCAIRKWLNEEFYTTAFFSEERDVIIDTVVDVHDDPNLYDPLWNGEIPTVNVGNDTVDKIYLPSFVEVNKYFSSDDDRRCASAFVAYVRKKMLFIDGEERYCRWLLRSQKYDNSSVCNVAQNGEIDPFGYGCDLTGLGIRPVMWVRTGIEDSTE